MSLIVNRPLTVLPFSDWSATFSPSLTSNSRVSPDLRPDHLLGKVLHDAVVEGQPLLDPDPDLGRLVQLLAVVHGHQVADDDVVRLDRGVLALLGDERPLRLQEPAHLVLDVLVGELVGRLAELHALVVGQVELGPDLDVELVDERPARPAAPDLSGVEFGRGERGDVRVLGELLEAGHQDFAADVLGDGRLELALDVLARGLAGAEPGDGGGAVLEQLVELLLEPLVDGVAVDGDLDVLLARADVGDLDGLLELAVARPAWPRPRWRRLVRLAASSGAAVAVSSAMGVTRPSKK